ncbi:cytochrome c oxidase subunit 1, partial [Cucurbita argyrosperma subsp. argyrosperma]
MVSEPDIGLCASKEVVPRRGLDTSGVPLSYRNAKIKRVILLEQFYVRDDLHSQKREVNNVTMSQFNWLECCPVKAKVAGEFMTSSRAWGTFENYSWFIGCLKMRGGYGNWSVPTMIGAPNLKFPRSSALIEVGSSIGWTIYPPLSGITSSSGGAVDSAITSVGISKIPRSNLIIVRSQTYKHIQT